MLGIFLALFQVGDIVAADEDKGGLVLAGAIAGRSVGILNECVAMLARRLTDGEVEAERPPYSMIKLTMCCYRVLLGVMEPLYAKALHTIYCTMCCLAILRPVVLGAKV